MTRVPADFICEHGMPQPWATCTDCMLLPRDQQPEPPPPQRPVAQPSVKRRRASAPSSGSGSTRTRVSPARPSTRLPRNDTDESPALIGDYDLAYEIPQQNVRYHVQGSDNDWLSISSFPNRLRDGGYVYLQVDRDLAARCRVKGVGFRERRWTHEAPEFTADAGPGATLELAGDEWEFVSIRLGPEAELETSGYRYLVTEPGGSIRVLHDDRPSMS